MKPFYSVEELGDLFGQHASEIADGLTACEVPLVYNGREADLRQWYAVQPRHDKDGSVVITAHWGLSPSPESVMVDADKLPARWKETISQAEGQAHASIPSNTGDEELARVARMDLWSQAELSGLCAGLLPGASNRTDDELAVVNAANEAIARGTLSGALAFVPRDDADTAARMYGTARHYVPAIAAEWAASRFDTFPASLLAAVRERAQATPSATAGAPAKDKPLISRERNNLLRIIRALAVMATLPDRGAAPSVEKQLETLGFASPKEATIRALLQEAGNLQPD